MTAVERFFLALLGLAGLCSIAGSNAGFGGLFLFFLARLLTGRWRAPLPAALLVLFFLWTVVAALLSPMQGVALHALPDFWSWFALLAASALAPDVRERLEWYSLPLSVSALAAGTLAALAFFLGAHFKGHTLVDPSRAGLPTGAFFSHHLTLAGAAAVAGFFLAGQALYGEHPRWRRVFLWVGAAASGSALLFSQGRSYYLAALPAGVILLWGKGRAKALGAALAALVLAVGLLAVGPASLRQRALSIFDPANASNTERIYLWLSGADMLMARPVAGWGPGTYTEASKPFREPYAHKVQHPGCPPGFQTDVHAHNLYLQVALDMGLVGLVLFLAALAAAGVSLWRCPDRALRFGVGAAFAAFLVGGIFEYNGGDAEVATLFLFILGLAFPGFRPKDRP